MPSLSNPMARPCQICGAIKGERCTDKYGVFLGVTHPMRSRKSPRQMWEKLYDARFRIEPKGGFFNLVSR